MMPFLSLLLLLTSSNVWALNLEYFRFTNDPNYSITEGALLNNSLVAKNYPYILTGAFDYVKTPLSIRSNNIRTSDVVSYLSALHLGGGYRFTDNFFVAARTYFAHTNKADSVGDSIVEAKYRFYQNSDTALALHPRLSLPTGNQTFTTDDKMGGYLGLNLEKKFSILQMAANLGYSEQPGATYSLGSNYTSIDYKKAIFTALGFVAPITETWALNIEGYRFIQFKGNQHPNEVYAGLRHQTTRSLAAFGGLAVGGPIDQSSNDYRLSLGIKFTPATEQEVVHTPPPVVHKKAPVNKREKILTSESQLYGDLIFSENIYFANNKYDLTELSKQILKKVHKRYKGTKLKPTIVLEGFASIRGNDHAHNLTLSENRGQETKENLTKLGVSPEAVKIVAYGDNRAEPDVDEALNRKVMIRFYEK
ncbi:MAG: OmpA family protein [Bacteriovoracaceae bacterium]